MSTLELRLVEVDDKGRPAFELVGPLDQLVQWSQAHAQFEGEFHERYRTFELTLTVHSCAPEGLPTVTAVHGVPSGKQRLRAMGVDRATRELPTPPLPEEEPQP